MNSQKRLTDVDSERQAILLNNFMRTVPFLGMLGLIMGGLPGLLIAAVTSAVVSVCTEVFSGMVGSGSINTLYGFGRRTSILRERLAADLSGVRFHKMKQDHDSALVKLEEILARDPFPRSALSQRPDPVGGLSGLRRCQSVPDAGHKSRAGQKCRFSPLGVKFVSRN